MVYAAPVFLVEDGGRGLLVLGLRRPAAQGRISARFVLGAVALRLSGVHSTLHEWLKWS